MRELLQLAEQAGCSALVFTVDMPVPSSRYRDFRSGLAGESGLRGDLHRARQAAARPRWAFDVGLGGRRHSLGNDAHVLGGRRLDGVPFTACALPPIADAVGDRLTVLADGGVRSGLDVVRMLSLVAHGVLLGRSWVYALGADGERGVARMVD